MKPAYELKDAVRGEIREGGDVLTFEFPPGPFPEGADERVVAHLVNIGVAVDPNALPAEPPVETPDTEPPADGDKAPAEPKKVTK